MKSGWQNYLFYAGIIVIGGFLLIETIRLKNTGFEGKSLWEWMELLIIPAVLAGGAILLNRSERALERKIADERIIEDRKIADDRAKLEREIATDRQQEAALQAYFDRMSELLLRDKLRTTEMAEVRDVARTRTISILRVLDTRRNNLVIQFLREAKLISDEKSILNHASMREMDLKELNLSGVYLRGVYLSNANLQGAILESADLEGADFFEADLQRANLSQANLQGAVLMGANLQRAILIEANLHLANLIGAKLPLAHLGSTDLHGANLSGANLEGADFFEANLSQAKLQGAKNMTKEQLAEAKSLEGATMPDGTIHE